MKIGELAQKQVAQSKPFATMKSKAYYPKRYEAEKIIIAIMMTTI